MPYLRRFFLVPADLEDDVSAELWEAGTLGVRSDPAPEGRVLLEAWFAPNASPLDLSWMDIEAVGEETVPDTDWLAQYRERAQPFPVAATLFVDPREPEEPAVETPEGRTLLRLPARAAFGIGSHESTSLALELIETLDLTGRDVLDAGTGTGILSFAALLRGARRAVGYDVDPASPFHARDNSRLNGLYPLFFAGLSQALREAPRFDLALINIVPEQILPEMPGLVRLLRPGGELILSGILTERGAEVLDCLSGLGYIEADRRTAGDWVAFRVAPHALRPAS
jgi:ribosomal protein L11 methyltransferase